MVRLKRFPGFLVVSLLALSLIPALSFVLALDPSPVHATHVDPTEVPGNPTCPSGTIELKVEPVADGTYTDGTLSVTIDVRDTDDGPVFDFIANIGIDAVIAKGGPNGNLYVYNPEATSDTGLHAPVNPSNGNFYGLSHISFCYDVEPPTATPTDTPTNTPVPPTATPTNTPTNTPVPPTATATNTPTNTPVPPTATATNTPTNTPKVTEEPPTPTATNTPTNTPVPPTATPTNTPTNTPTPKVTEEPTGGNPIGEPGAPSSVYLPLVIR